MTFSFYKNVFNMSTEAKSCEIVKEYKYVS